MSVCPWCKEHKFKHISGSKQWPSSRKKDTPFDKFRCKDCGWEFTWRVNGVFREDELSTHDQDFDKIIEAHCLLCGVK